LLSGTFLSFWICQTTARNKFNWMPYLTRLIKWTGWELNPRRPQQE
jgi:hypothetical protein